MSTVVSYKFIILGSSGVGKTAILKRLVEDRFDDDLQSTIGVEFDSTILNIDDRKVRLQIWDTAGQERFRAISKAYYRNAIGVLLVFDIADRKSFDELSTWLTDIRSLCDPNAIVQLIGNKADLVSERAVTLNEAEEFATHQHMQYLETSAKLGQNVRDAFIKVATSILTKGIKNSAPAIGRSPLLNEKPAAAESGSCC
jgi:small GTP-binding protein